MAMEQEAKDEVNGIEQAVIALCQELVGSLAPGLVLIDVKRRPVVDFDGVSIWITPTNKQCARIIINPKDGEPIVPILLGMGTHVELQPKKDLSLLAQVRETCNAVFNGDFEEKAWLVGLEVVRCVGRLTIRNKVQKYYYVGRFFPFRRKVKKEIKYAPYGTSC